MRLVTKTAQIIPSSPLLLSFSEMKRGPNGLLYVANELSGQEIVSTTAVARSGEGSIFTFDLSAQSSQLVAFTNGLTVPEGLHFSPRTEEPYLTMSYEDYLDWVEEGMPAEWVDGGDFEILLAYHFRHSTALSRGKDFDFFF